MKYVIIVIVILSILFGIQLYFNSNSDTQKNNQINNMNELIIKDEVLGNGEEATAGKTITVNYKGYFQNGEVFDSSYERGQPFKFKLGVGQVIQGWDQGFAGMKVGGKRNLTIPPNLGYGMNDYHSIPGGSVLIFDVELLKVE